MARLLLKGAWYSDVNADCGPVLVNTLLVLFSSAKCHSAFHTMISLSGSESTIIQCSSLYYPELFDTHALENNKAFILSNARD